MKRRICSLANGNTYYHRLFSYPIIVVVIVDSFSSYVIVAKVVRPAFNFVLPIVGGSVFAICSNDFSVSVDSVILFLLIQEDVYRLRVVWSVAHFSLDGSSLENDNTSSCCNADEGDVLRFESCLQLLA